MQFEGTVLLVSHDRTFLNNVVTSTIVFEEDGVREYVGGYDDWVRQCSARPTNSISAKSSGAPKNSRSPEKPTAQDSPKPAKADDNRKRRPSFKERQERESLPALIEQIETEVASLHAAMAEPEYYRQTGEQIAAEAARLKQLKTQLTVAYQRWEELDELAE